MLCGINLPRLFERYIILLKQQLARMNDWLSKAEKRMKQTEEVGTNFDTIKQQLDKHQVGFKCQTR